MAYVLSSLVLLIGLFLAWFTGAVLHLTGTSLLLSRILFVLIGIGGAALILWLNQRTTRKANNAATPTSPTNTNDLDTLLRDASAKLAAAQRTGPKSFDTLPLLYVLGDDNSGKTTTILKSSLDPELLAGQIYRDQQIIPTTVANFFYSQQCALVEAGSAVRPGSGGDPRLWARIIRRTRPRAYRSLFGKAAPIRAAVVCISAEAFLGAAASETVLASARATNQQLRDLSQQLGIEVPVYVILTKLDRVPNFNEFVRNLSTEEATQVFGISLPRAGATAGLYADQAAKDIGTAVDKLAFSLAEFRLDLLPRESDQTRLPGIYEFPRELRKLRNNITAYLVELARPSHLNTNPYLRGFYFTGVRAAMVDQLVTAPAAAPQAAQANAGATQIFSLHQQQAAAAQPIPQVVTQKVAQWSFLPRIFPEVILGDRSALANTSKTGRANLFRRILYGTAAALIFAYLILLAVSYGNNSALEKQITGAASALPYTSIPQGQLASERDLVSLDQLRAAIVQLEDYQTNGAPLMYRWGIYHGDQLLSGARTTYFDRFRRQLLTNTQSNLVAYLSALPATPTPDASYDAAYAPLRAYLITTANPDKSTPEFLSPVLMQYWQGSLTPSSDQQKQLARRQFDFYANELRMAAPYSIAPVMPAVTHARSYLSNFGGFERIYQSMLTAAGKSNPAIDFNRAYPHSAETVVEPHIVPGAFTRSGFAFIEDAIKHPDRYFSGEAWVLGDQAPPSLDRATLTQQLATRYTTDFLTQWRTFLQSASVVRYRNLQDASAKLTTLAGNNSPLLALIYTVSHNTAVADPQIANTFQPAQSLVPPESIDRFISPGNTPYVTGLLGLQGSVAQVAQNPAGAADPAAATPIITAATAAHMAARQTAQAFRIDPQGHTDARVLALMEDPITSTEALVRGLGPAQANAGGKSFCSAFNQTLSKFPFNPSASVQASPAEVAALLQPGTGSLWQFYNANLKTLLIPTGAQYGPAPNPPMQVTPAFTRFFNRLVALSNDFFPAGATAPTLNFTLRNIPAKGIQGAALTIDGQQLNVSSASKQFTWNSQTAHQAQLNASYAGASNLPLLQMQGTWAVFQLIDKAHVQRTPGGALLGFPLEVSGTPITFEGTPLVVQFELSGPGADILTPGNLTNLRCVSEVAR